MSHAVAQDQTRASAKFLEMGVNNTWAFWSYLTANTMHKPID
jgi:hypothetical protein